MNQPKFPLDLVKVASPCTAPWGAMAGDDRVRFCSKCEQHVYNLSGMTHAEAEALVSENEGKLCVRFYRRVDGTMLTSDCPFGWRALKVRIALVGSIMAMIMAMGFSLFAHIFAAKVRDPHDGFRLGNPIVRIRDILFPPPPREIMGKM